jgi:hypothetical protein
MMVLIAALAWRVTVAVFLSTSFVPDEYYQTVEPSFNFVNRRDLPAAANTWEWQEGYEIRSYVPLAPYLLLHHAERAVSKIRGVGAPDVPVWVMTAGPRVVQGIGAAMADWLLHGAVCRVAGRRAAFAVLAVQWASWSGVYCMSRTLINSLEAVLLVVAAYLACDAAADNDGGDDEDEDNDGNEDGGDAAVAADASAPDPDRAPPPAPAASDAAVAADSVKTRVAVAPWLLPCVAALSVHARPTSVLFLGPLLLLKVTSPTSRPI